MFRTFLNLCSSSSVQNQVSPVIFRAGIYEGEGQSLDDEEFPLYPDRQNSDGIKLKPKVEHNTPSTKKHAIEDELFMFVLDLQLSEFVMDQKKFMVDSNKNCFCYTYDNNNELTLLSILVLVLRNTAIGRVIPNSSGASVSGKNIERKANLLFACKCLVQLLNDYQEYPRDHDPSSPYNGNPFTSIEKALIVSDIFLVALINFVSLSANRKVVEESLNLHVHELLQAILRIGSCLSLCESEAVKHLWAQITARSCSLLFYIVHVLKSTAAVNIKLMSGYIKNMSDLVNILHSIGSALTLVKMQLGGASAGFYTCSVLFWEACSRVLLLLKSKSYQATDSKQNAMDPRYFMLCSQLMSTFYVSVPSSFEILQEMRGAVERDGFDMQQNESEDHNLLNLLIEMQAFRQAKRGNSSSVAEDEDGGGLLFALQRQTAQDITTRSAEGENLGDLTPNTPHLRTNGMYFSQMTFRARYLLAGVTYLLKVSEFRREYSSRSNSTNNLRVITDNSIMLSLNVPNKPAWIVTLAECLLTVLVPRGTGAALCGYHSLDVLTLGPFLADLLLKVQFGSADGLLVAPHAERLDVIYWELAKQLGLFTDLLKRRLRSLTDSHGSHHYLNASAHTATSPHSASSRSHHSTTNDYALKQQRNAVPAVFSLSLDTPAKDSVSSQLFAPLSNQKRSNASSPQPLLRHTLQTQSHLQQPQSQRTQSPYRYEVNDLVDGMCELANGSKRWYPGKILSVDRATNTYSLAFNDGEVVHNKSVEEIRYTKRRVPSNASTDSRVVRPTAAATSQISEPLVVIASIPIVIDVSSVQLPVPSKVMITNITTNEEPEAMSVEIGKGSFITPIKTSLSTKDITCMPSPDIDLLYSPFTDKDTQSFRTVAGLKNMSIKSVQHDDLDGDDALEDSSHFSDDDHVYEIPSVFEGGNARIANIIKSSGGRESIVPLMRFDQLDMTSALPQTSSGFSLSSTLISDQSFRAVNMSSGRQPVHSFRSAEGNSGNHFHLNLPHKSSSHHSGGNGKGSEHFADELSGATRMLSWRAQESGRASDRTANMGFRPVGPPSDAYLAASREVNQQKTSTHGQHGQFAGDSFLELGDEALSVLVQTFSAVSGVLLQRCLVDNMSFLDHRCCACSEPDLHNQSCATASKQNSGRPGASPLNLSSSVDCAQTNMVFNIREFMEVCQGGGAHTASLAELCMLHSDGALRLCKLLNGEFFRNCLPRHMDSGGVKIGEGGFGTVFQVCCTDSCGGFKQYKNCLSCYRRSISLEAAASAKHTLSGKCVCWHASHHTNNSHSFAVKRIPRERSVYDNPVVLDLFNEISALETLSSRIGVCGLEDYGVHGSEYWLVMENGGMNLLEWRLQAQSTRYVFLHRRGGGEKEASVRSTRSDADMPICAEDLSVLLTLFSDALLIVQSVHAADVAHFDIKCNNFVLRDDPRKNIAYMRLCHAQGKPSGILFLADFGEAVCHVSRLRSHPMKPKCRGTITIQSPEMLCAADMTASKATPQSLFGARAGDRLSSIRGDSVNSSSGSLSALPVNINSPGELTRVAQKTAGKPGRKIFVDLPNTNSDIWSLGCMLYELLDSNQLFLEATWVELYHKLCMEPFVPIALPGLSDLLRGVKNAEAVRSIEGVIQGAMRQEPASRSSLGDMFIEIQKVVFDLCAAAVSMKQVDLKVHTEVLPNKQLVRVAQQEQNNRGASPTSECSSPVDGLQSISHRYSALSEQYSALNFSHMHMGCGVYLALENSAEVLAHFDRHHNVQHTSRDPFNLDPLDINLDVPQAIGSMDRAIRDSSLSRTVGEIGRAVAHRQMRLDGGLIWVRVSKGTTAASGNGEKNRVFERFVRNGGKVCATLSILLGDAQDLSLVVTVVQKILSKTTGLYVHGQSIVVVSVDSAVLSVDLRCSLEQRSREENVDVSTSGGYFDKQSLSVGVAFCGLLTSWIANSSDKGESIRGEMAPSQSAASISVERVSTVICLDRLVQLWRCLPWFEAGCSQEIVDFIVRRIHEDSL